MEKTEEITKEPAHIQSFNGSTAVTGFAGGIFWGFMGYIAYLFNFVSFGPSMILMPWAVGDWKHTMTGQWVGIVAIGVVSIGLAFLYRALAARINSVWPGLTYGVLLWLAVFILLHPLYEGTGSNLVLNLNSVVTSLALYILYGLFTGYSISYDYHERKAQKRLTIQD